MMKKVLLADDSITIRKVVGIIFAVEDYQLLTAGDGDSAYDMATTEKPDLVIADISMPGKNGFELCRAIKSNQDLSATSVLLLTGAFESFDEDRASEVAADGWLVKPFESQALLDKVTQLLESAPQRLAVADEVEAFTVAEEEDFFADDLAAADKQELSDTPVTEELSIEDDDDVWREVPFADEDLKSQDLPASTDENEPEEGLEEDTFGDLDLSGEDAIAADATGSTDVSEAVDDADEDLLSADNIDADADADELIELMEDDLTEEDSLVEDEQTFIGHAEDRHDNFVISEEEDEDILDLTESDVITAGIDEDEPPIADETVATTETTAFVAEDKPLSSAAAADQDDSADFVFQGDDEQVDTGEPDFSFATPDDADEGDEDITAVEDEQDFTFVAEPESSPVAEQPADAVYDSDHIGHSFEPEPERDFSFAPHIEPKTQADSLTDEAAEQAPAVDEAVAEDVAEDVAEETPLVTPFVAGQEDKSVALDEVSPEPTTDQTTDQAGDQEPTSRQLEEQLAALSEDELRQIVERVAGPMIEKLAKEMLEQVIWEVVPDLAETMISAEIAKLKQDNG